MDLQLTDTDKTNVNGSRHQIHPSALRSLNNSEKWLEINIT